MAIRRPLRCLDDGEHDAAPWNSEPRGFGPAWEEFKASNFAVLDSNAEYTRLAEECKASKALPPADKGTLVCCTQCRRYAELFFIARTFLLEIAFDAHCVIEDLNATTRGLGVRDSHAYLATEQQASDALRRLTPTTAWLRAGERSSALVDARRRRIAQATFMSS